MKSEERARILCFGEVLLRLSAPRGARIANAPNLTVHVGGAEANVGAMLAQLGQPSEMITALPSSPLGDLCEAELRRTGLRTDNTIRSDGRLGLYFFEENSRAGGGRVIYDRSDSAFARSADMFDWPTLVRNARWLHLSGINLALGGQVATSAIKAAQEMRAAGGTLSFDVNHRASLWEGRPPEDFERMRELVGMVDVLFASARDLSLLLGSELPHSSAQDRRRCIEAAFSAFANLQLIASTRRSFNDCGQLLSARLDSRGDSHETEEAALVTIVDRIGSGDAFAGAVIDGILRDASLKECAAAGLSAAVTKHGIVGDRWIGTRKDLETSDPLFADDIRR
jgi:2-dehydro-3-deoxygluconokinase